MKYLINISEVAVLHKGLGSWITKEIKVYRGVRRRQYFGGDDRICSFCVMIAIPKYPPRISGTHTPRRIHARFRRTFVESIGGVVGDDIQLDGVEVDINKRRPLHLRLQHSTETAKLGVELHRCFVDLLHAAVAVEELRRSSRAYCTRQTPQRTGVVHPEVPAANSVYFLLHLIPID